jgi:hypothetical protein
MKLQLEGEQSTVASLAAKLENALAAQQRAEGRVADIPGLTAQVLNTEANAKCRYTWKLAAAAAAAAATVAAAAAAAATTAASAAAAAAAGCIYCCDRKDPAILTPPICIETGALPCTYLAHTRAMIHPHVLFPAAAGAEPHAARLWLCSCRSCSNGTTSNNWTARRPKGSST